MKHTVQKRLLMVLVLGFGACFLPELKEEKPQQQSDPCTDCAAVACADTFNACFADPTCAALLQCVLPCDDGAGGSDDCVQACIDDPAHAEGLTTAIPLAACTSMSCVDACPPIPAFGAGGAGGAGGN